MRAFVRSMLLIALAAMPAGAAERGLTSAAFVGGAAVPVEFTCSGPNHSPPLAWTDPPAGTKAFALLVEDPDAPSGTFTHWVLYDLPATTHALPAAVPADERLPSGGVQGVSDARKVGWFGPCPPPGPVHHYVFRLLALDASTGLGPRASRGDVLAATHGHVLAESRLVGTFRRE